MTKPEAHMSENPKAVSSVYRWYAPHYDSSRRIWNPFFAARAEKKFIELMCQYIEEGADILDVGVGTGLNIERVLNLGIDFNSYEGIDLSPEMLAAAREKFGHMGNVELHQGDIMHMELTKEYDTIISTLVFSHLSKQDEVVKKLLSALKPGKVLLLLFFAAKASPNLLDRLALYIDRSIFKFNHVSADVIERFPSFEQERHFSCLGGQMSIYAFKK